MPRGRPVAPVELSEEAEAELTRISRSRSLPSSLVQRAQIVLACAVGASNTAVAARLGVGAATVGRWRRRYRERGLEGLHDELRPGRPRTYDDERVATVINDALQTKPPARTHWSVRAMASHSGISKSTVQRWFKLFGLHPHRHQYFKLSTDPFFIEKVRDIVGLYLDPPDHAVVLCVDEKIQTQALQRSQPVLPMGLGYVEGVTHDYGRHGTTTLFAALEVATGTVITDCKTRHRHQEFLGFLRRIDANVPADLDVHLIVDNYVTHKHARVKAWLAKRPRYHVHYTPTYMPPGSTRWNDGSASSPSRPSAGARSAACRIWSGPSIASSSSTTPRPRPSSGPPPPNRSSPRSRDLHPIFPERHTRTGRDRSFKD